jgi:hypothetical protein
VFGFSAGSNLKPGEEKKTGMVILKGMELPKERKKPGKLQQNQGAGFIYKVLPKAKPGLFFSLVKWG